MVRGMILMMIVSVAGFAQIPVNQKASSDYMHYYERAEELLSKRNYEEALIHINEALNINALYPEAYYTRGAIKEKLDDKEGALRDYTIYLELNPDQFDALFRKALLNFELEKWARANADFRQLIKLPTGETTSIYFRQGQFAEGTNQVFTSQSMNKAHLFNYLGLTEFEMKDYAIALTHFDSAVSHNPEVSNYYVNAGRCHEALEQFDKAKADYQAALKINPDHQLAQHNLSVLNRKYGTEEEAAKLLDDVIYKNPDLPFPYAERAYHEMNNGALTKALTDYNKAIELSPKTSDYWLGRGKVKEKLGNWKGAYGDYSQSIVLNEKDEKAWLARANLMHNQGNHNEAIKDYDVAILLYEAYAIAYYNRAISKNKLGMNAEACEDLKRANVLGFEIQPRVMNSICEVQ
ncbi:MAG: tetratricopeptide repeat protein [Cyclobacteriaceae bacterium]